MYCYCCCVINNRTIEGKETQNETRSCFDINPRRRYFQINGNSSRLERREIKNSHFQRLRHKLHLHQSKCTGEKMTVSPQSFLRLRKKLGLSRQAVAVEMSNSISFNTLFNYEHGVPVNENTLAEIKKWMESKK